MLRKYKPFLKAGAMNAFAYKSAIFTWLIISILQIICVVFLWVAVYKNSSDGMDSVINGFTFKEMIVYTVFVNIFGFATLGGDTLFMINEDIKKGTIDLAFTKPISYRVRLMSENLGNLLAVNLMIGIPGFTIAFIVFGLIDFITITPLSLIISILLFIVAQVIANLLNDTISYICGVLCFYTSSGWGINQAKEVIIITNQAEEIANDIYRILGRTVTIMDGQGLINGDTKILYVIVTRFELSDIRNIVDKPDRQAFITISEVTEIYGNHIKKKPKQKKKAEVLEEQSV